MRGKSIHMLLCRPIVTVCLHFSKRSNGRAIHVIRPHCLQRQNKADENGNSSQALVYSYLSKVLRNYTEQACDGDFLSVRCPPRTTITVQSAFYGRRGPAYLHPCPTHLSLLSGARPIGEELQCHVSTSLQKMQDECQDRRSCQVLVNSRLFGADPCPSTSKYLTLRYKCRPNEYKSKVVCEGERMRLSCKSGMQIAVYSAMFGRTQQGTLECPPNQRRAPSVELLTPASVVLTSRQVLMVLLSSAAHKGISCVSPPFLPASLTSPTAHCFHCWLFLDQINATSLYVIGKLQEDV
ncbi:hypothetical protein ACEWY4_022430 [Coilia grayii]|uniref:SUEL-type lectin domain-containing protein n=1 Tax=Coilia grayii TaxID=363190 RepID=A0ABD1J5Z3_9TELE